MTYTGYFRDINDKQYRVVITTSSGSGNTEIKMGTDPFITELETSESHIFKPAKYSSATIRLVTNNYLFDLYAATAQENKVVLYDSDNNIKWIGYITANLYSQGYENEVEEVEIEAIDALSTLQYYNYTTISDTKEIVSFKQVLDKLLTKCNAYKEYYVSTNMQLVNSTVDKLIDNLFISEQNFFDEDNEPMTMQEVLEEISQYLGLTCVADSDVVYFLDYEAIKNNINTYYKYSLTNTSTTATLVTLQHSYSIDADSYAENGQQISLDNVYNKAVVKDSLYSFESIIPSIWDENYLTNWGGDWSYVEEVDEEFRGMYKCFFKYYKHKNYTSYYYDKDTKMMVTPLAINYSSTQYYIGATICQHFSEKVTSYDVSYNDINYTDYVLLHVHDTYDGTLRPLFTLSVNDVNPSFLGSDTYIIIKGNFLFTDREGKMFDIKGYSNKDDDFNPENLYIECMLRVGDSYWNGSNWQTTSTTFKLYFSDNGQTAHCINQSFPVKNNITWDMGLDGEEGYAIPMPDTNKVITGKPTFTLYQPHRLDSSYRCDAVWLSNFDIIAKVQNFNKDSEKDSDTEYSNVIDEDYVNNLNDIEMKICTWDNKEANYSAVAKKLNNDYQFVDTVYNRATNNTHRFEEHYIYKLVTQYQTPSCILNLNLKNNIKLYTTVTDKYLQGKTFIVDSITEKYADAAQEIKLIEKK